MGASSDHIVRFLQATIDEINSDKARDHCGGWYLGK